MKIPGGAATADRTVRADDAGPAGWNPAVWNPAGSSQAADPSASRPAVVAAWNRDGSNIFANDAYLDWFGVTADQLRTTRLPDLLGTAQYEQSRPFIDRALAGHRQVFQRSFIDPSGLARNVQVEYTPHRFGDQIVGNLAVLVDITDRVQAKLASKAAAADVARLLTDSDRRAGWLRAEADLTHALLTEPEVSAELSVVNYALTAAESDLVVLLSIYDSDRLVILAAAGRSAADITGLLYPHGETHVESVIAAGRPAVLDDQGARAGASILCRFPVAEVLVVPLVAGNWSRGVVNLVRAEGQPAFTAADLDNAAAYCRHAAVAMEVMETRDAHVQLARSEHTNQISRSLHDHVIQRLFATAIQLQITAALTDPAAVVDKLNALTDDLDTTVGLIRTTVFRPGSDGVVTAPACVSRQLRDLLEELKPGLGVTTEVEIGVGVDTAIPPDLATDLIAFTRRLLLDIVQHSGAHHVKVALHADARHATVELTDDSTGLGGARRRASYAQLDDLATAMTATFHTTAADPTGTRHRLTAPLHSGRAPTGRPEPTPTDPTRPAGPLSARTTFATSGDSDPDGGLERLCGLVRDCYTVHPTVDN